MSKFAKRMKIAAHLGAVALVVAGCALPRSGPSRTEIMSGSRLAQGDVSIVEVTDEIAELSKSIQSLGFDSSFQNAAPAIADRISSGDVGSIASSCWSSVA